MELVSRYGFIFLLLKCLDVVAQSGTINTTSSTTTATPTPANTSSSNGDSNEDWLTKLLELFKEHHIKILFFSAGFMTASLIFSVGCFVSKYKTSPSDEADTEQMAENGAVMPLLDTGPNHAAHATDGSDDSDPKSYSYCNIDVNAKSSDDFSTSSRSNKRLRESYDLVDRNRIDSSVVIDNEIPNPYTHVTINMEATEYDSGSYLKPRSEVKDPTYSHLVEVKPKTSKSHDISQHTNDTYECRAIPSTSGLKSAIDKKEDKKQKKPKPKRHPEANKENAKSNQEDKIMEGPKSVEGGNTVVKTVDNVQNDCTETQLSVRPALNRNRCEYSFVRKNSKFTDADTAEKQFILSDNEDSLGQAGTSGDESKGSGSDTSAYSSSMIGDDSSVQTSDDTSDQSANEVRTECSINMATVHINQLYEDCEVTEDGVVITPLGGSEQNFLDTVLETGEPLIQF